MTTALQGTITAVCRKADPGLPKLPVSEIHLIADHGVEGDYHAGKYVRHRYLAKKDPARINTRQILIADEATYAELEREGISLEAGSMGENIVVRGLAIMSLPEGTRLNIGEAELEITEIRTPCKQLNGMHGGLLQAVVSQEQGQKIYRAGIMARVHKCGIVHPGDSIVVQAQDQDQAVAHFERG